jgi:hypothetical protein
MYPARTSSWWLGTSASAGSSRRVRTNRFDIDVINAGELLDQAAPQRAALARVSLTGVPVRSAHCRVGS